MISDNNFQNCMKSNIKSYLTFWNMWHLLRTLRRHNHSMAILQQEISRRKFFWETKGNLQTELCWSNDTNAKLTVVAINWSNQGKFWKKKFYCQGLYFSNCILGMLLCCITIGSQKSKSYHNLAKWTHNIAGDVVVETGQSEYIEL